MCFLIRSVPGCGGMQLSTFTKVLFLSAFFCMSTFTLNALSTLSWLYNLNTSSTSGTRQWEKVRDCHVQSFWTPTTMKGKTRLMRKKLSQFTEPAIMYAAGRVACVNSSVVKMLVTPPSRNEEQQKKSPLVLTVVQQQLLRNDFKVACYLVLSQNSG